MAFALKNPQSLFMDGELAFDSGDYKEARRCYEAALEHLGGFPLFDDPELEELCEERLMQLDKKLIK